MRKFLQQSILFLLASYSADEAAAAASLEDSLPSLSTSPFHHQHDFAVEPALQTRDGNFQSIEATLKSRFEFDLTSSLELDTATRVRTDAFDRLEPGQPDQAETAGPSRRILVGDRTELELREFYLRAQGAPGTITAGKQQIIWGTADGLRLLDVVNPHDFRKFILDDFVDSRTPLWALNAEVPLKWPWSDGNQGLPSSTFLQAVWLPDKSYNRLPEPGAVYEFTSPLFVPSPQPGVAYEQNPPDRPDRFFADSDAGLRLSSFVNDWDLSLNYLYHYYDNPGFFREVIVRNGQPVVSVTPRYKRSHLIGGTAGTAFGDWTFRSELATFLNRPFSTGDPRDPDGAVTADEAGLMLGLDWFGLQDTLFSWQLFQSWLLQEEPLLFRDRVEFNFTQLIRREFFDARLALELMWLQGLNRGDGLLRPRVTYEWSGNSEAWLGADFFYGNPDGLFGQFHANDRVITGVRFRF